MTLYTITFMKAGKTDTATTEAESKEQALYYFDMCVPNDGIISIEETTNEGC